MDPFCTTQIRANMANLGALDADLAKRMEEMYIQHAGNRMSYSCVNAGALPAWSAGSSHFGVAGAPAIEFQLPWEQQVGFDHVRASVYLTEYIADSTPPSLRLSSGTWVNAHTTQVGAYTQARTVTLLHTPVAFLNGQPFAFQSYFVECDLAFPSGYAADRRMLLSFDLETDATIWISGVHLEDVAPAYEA